jgi:hypothetical protein
MLSSPPDIDALDAALVGAGTHDLVVLVSDIRDAYVSDEPLRRLPALSTFIDAPLVAADPDATGAPAGRRRTLRLVGGITAGVAGKIVLGAAIAAASVAGLQASGLVDVPGLPDSASHRAVEAVSHTVDDTGGPVADGSDSDGNEASDAATQGQETAAEARTNQAAAADFTNALHEWQACVDVAGDDEAAVAACGDRPRPGDFGLAGPPANSNAGGNGGGNPDPGTPPPNSNAGGNGSGNPDPGTPPPNSNAGGNGKPN